MDIENQVRDFITTNFYLPDWASLGNDASLLDGGVVDSTGVLEVVSFLEEHFGVKLADSEILPENLDSIDRIADLVRRKRKAA